ncbi:MAG TPA: hypothetical protein VFJ30_16390 [Phycisphaerae bacterium]|nr:hypothetical protein [Phycisphaerae bacterium]
MVLSSAPAADPPAAPAGADDAMVKAIKVLPDRAPDCSSLKGIAESVTRDGKTNDEKFIALYNFMIISHYHRAYPPAGPSLLWFNNYGWSLCGGLASLQSSLYKEMGWGWRHVGWPGHNMAEAKYDGTWHWFDCFQKFYAWRPDPDAPGGRTVACQDDLARDPQNLLVDGFFFDPARKVVYPGNDRLEMIGGKLNWTAPAQLTCGDSLPGIVQALPKRRIDGENAGSWNSGAYSGEVRLMPGFSLTNTWDALLGPEESWPQKDNLAVGHTCGNKDLRNDPVNGPVLEPYYQRVRSYSNGVLTCAPDFGSEAVLQSFVATDNVKYAGGALVPAEAGRPASVTVRLESPYLIMKATGAADGADTVEVSADGKTFRKADLKDFTPAGNRRTWTSYVRIGFQTALKSLKLEATVLNNAGALPFLSPGKNPVKVSVADAKALGKNRLVVTYAYAPGCRSKSFEQLFDEGKHLFAQQSATWAENPTVVQKTFAAGDLPAAFQIDVPTPKGKYPVYPRMIFLRREVVAPGAKPLPVPDKAQPPKMGPEDELKTMPNPWLIGSRPAPGHVEPPTITKRVATLKASHAACKTGEVAENHFVKWPVNDDKQTWVMLVGGELKGLPASKEIAKARLAVPVVRGKDQAATKVCVVTLKAPFEAGKPYDFANLGDVVATFTVPKQGDKGDYDPPKVFKADLTPYVKQLARGEGRFVGLAIRVQQDRSVDDGYIIRIDMPKAADLPLEVDVYDAQPTAAK